MLFWIFRLRGLSRTIFLLIMTIRLILSRGPHEGVMEQDYSGCRYAGQPKLIIIIFSIMAALFSCTGMNPGPSSGDDSGVPAGWSAPVLNYDEDAYFAAEVTEFLQAPGQYANSTAYNIKDNKDKVLGAPAGGGVLAPDISSSVSLGMAGGSVTVKFEPPLANHPDNIGGFDFIVFGNAYWYDGNPATSWKEPAVIWVMKDENGNSLPDDKWYLIPGSHLSGSSSPESVTYDNDPVSPELPDSEYISSWWPSGATSPMEITGTYLLPDSLYDTSGNGAGCSGYADVTPTLKLGDLSGADGSPGDDSTDDTEDYPAIKPAYFYTVPDTPGDTKIDAGSGGGDAVDIGSAVDPDTFAAANLNEVSWIKFVSATKLTGILGEYSAEIDAVARVRRKDL